MKHKITTIVVLLASIMPTPGLARAYIPPAEVGPPGLLVNGRCLVSIARPNGAGPGTAIPFRALMLGAPVERTTTSFTTGGSGTANFALAEQRKAAGLPYEPPTVNPDSAALPATFAGDPDGPPGRALYQRMPLTASKRIAEPFGLIFATATSRTRGRIAALTLSIAGLPAAAPRARVTIDGPTERGCRPQTIQIYAPSIPASALANLSAPNSKGCHWFDLAQCPREQWPRGRVLFVSPLHDNTFEYRWIDYDLLAGWYLDQVRAAAENGR